jgi:quercetin dioxygenase-like cupin family protein
LCLFVAKSDEMSIQVERWSEPTPPQAKELREQLESEGYSVFQWRDAPGTKYGPHAHAEGQSHWIVSGELKLRVGHESYVLRAGDRDFLPANTIHSALVPGDQPVVYLIGAKH